MTPSARPWRRRRGTTYPTGITLLVALTGLTGCHPDMRTSPRLETSTRTFKVGDVPQGQPIRVEVELWNRGSVDLTIDNIVNDCGCTTVAGKDAAIPPGERRTFTIVVETDSFEGPVEKNVRMFTNDPNASPIIFTVGASVIPEFVISEPVIDFGVVAPSSPLRKHVRIMRRAASEVRVLSVRSTAPEVKTVLHNSDSGATGAQLTMTLDTRRGRRLIFGNVIVSTSSTAMPELKLPVRAIVKR